MQRIKVQVAKQERMAVAQANKDRLQVPGLAIGTAPNVNNVQASMANKERRKSAFNVLQHTLQLAPATIPVGVCPPSPSYHAPPSPQHVVPPVAAGFVPSKQLQELFEKYCVERESSESSNTSSQIDYDFLAMDINLQTGIDDDFNLDIDYDALMASDYLFEGQECSYASNESKSNQTQSWPTESSRRLSSRLDTSRNSTV